MKRILGYSVLTAVLLAVLWEPLLAPTYTYVVKELPQTFSGLMTFSAGISARVPLTLTYDAAVATPPTPTAALAGTTLGTCRADTEYKLYTSYVNLSGETILSSGVTFQPSSGNTNRITVTRGAIGSNVDTWRVWFSRSGGGETHNVFRGCGASGAAVSVAAATTTQVCPCGVTQDPTEPSSNTTRALTMLSSSGSATLASISRPELAVKEVCAIGCEYTTASAALAAISDNTFSKRYLIHLRAPYYNVNDGPTMKSYVTLKGDGPDTTVLGNVTMPAGVVDVTLADLAVNNGITTSGAGGGPVYLDRVYCGGLVTGQTGAGSPACWLDLNGQWVTYASGVHFTANLDTNLVNVGSRSRWIGTGNHYRADVASGTTHVACWVFSSSDDGAEIIDVGSTCEINYSGTAQTDSQQASLRFNAAGSTSAAGNVIDLSGSVIKINNTVTSGSTGALRCVYLQEAGVNSKTSSLTLTGFRCSITTADSSQEIHAIEIDSDTGWSNWTMNWDDGSISMTGAGGATYDVDNADTTLVPKLNGVRHSATYTGAGTVNNLNARQACTVITDLADTDDNFEFWQTDKAVTIRSAGCYCRGTCTTTATLTLEDRAGNAMTISGTPLACAKTAANATYQAVTAANTLVAGEGIAFDVTNTPNPLTDEYTICVTYTIN